MSRFELVRDGAAIHVGDTFTVVGNGEPFIAAVTVTDLEPPEPDFFGCVHYTDQTGAPYTCSAESLGAAWHYDGQPFQPDPYDDREDFDSGRWTLADTDSMERDRELPTRNDAGEPMY